VSAEQPDSADLVHVARPSIVLVTDYQDRGSSVQARQVYINVTYLVAMEPWGTKYKIFVGRSLEYVVSPEDAQRLSQAHSA
jgi:hypothetical protein